MTTLIALALFGALGAVARYGTSIALLRWAGPAFPWGTLAVNIVGCFLLGLLNQTLVGEHAPSAQARAVLGAGFLGAFTTFSTFGVETYRALEAGQWRLAIANVACNLIGGLLAVALGIHAGRMFGR